MALLAIFGLANIYKELREKLAGQFLRGASCRHFDIFFSKRGGGFSLSSSMGVGVDIK